MLKIDEEERKKRLKEAKDIVNSINFGNSYNSTNFSNTNNLNDLYQQRMQEARDIVNSINHVSVEPTSYTDTLANKTQKSNALTQLRDFVQNDNGQEDRKETISNNNISEQEDNTRIETTKKKISDEDKKQIEEKISEQSKQPQTVSTDKNFRDEALKNIKANDTNVKLVSNDEAKNAKEISQIEIKAMEEANEINKKLENGEISGFEAWTSTVLNNVLGGTKKVASGLANVATTLAALGVRGLTTITSLAGNEEASKNLDEVYNNIVQTGSDIKAEGDYQSMVTNRLDNEFIKASGNVSSTVTEVATNAAIGYVTGVPQAGTIVQGLMVGGDSAQEVLDKNKDNIGQATVTGIAKGYVSYLTENMFDANILTRGKAKTSIEKAINNTISKTINSKLGKELAYKTVGVLGENAEEFVEDNIGYLLDKLINDEDLPSWNEWLANASETAKVTTISTIVLNLLGLGGGDFENIENDMQAEYWINKANEIIQQEDLAIHYNPEITKKISDMKEFYVTKFDNDKELTEITPTLGKEIINPNSKLNVDPVVIQDNTTNFYQVIDGNTGVILDSTYYDNTMEAQFGFDEKVRNLSDVQIESINSKIEEADYSIKDKIVNTINQAREEISQRQIENNISENQQSDIIEQNNNQTQEINNQNNEIAQNGISELTGNNEYYEYINDAYEYFQNDAEITDNDIEEYIINHEFNYNDETDDYSEIYSDIVNQLSNKLTNNGFVEHNEQGKTWFARKENLNSDEYILERNKLPTEEKLDLLKDLKEKIETKINELNSNGHNLFYNESKSSADATYIDVYNSNNEIIDTIRVANHYKNGISGNYENDIDMSQYNSKKALLKEIENRILKIENSKNNKSFEDIVDEAMNNYETDNEVESPLQNRDMKTIGKETNVNAYQYDNPEVKPYFQEMAQMIGEDLSYVSSQENRSSVKGGGTKLSTTTKAITTLHDELGYSYNDIAKGLQNIIDDNGKENNAISKKLELIIDEQLRNGYINALGKNIEPNKKYINTIQQNKELPIKKKQNKEQQINELGGELLSKETKNNFKMQKVEIIENKRDLIDKIERALKQEDRQTNFTIGGIKQKTIDRIKRDVNANIFKEKQYSMIVNDDDIIHISKHFNTKEEIAEEIIRLLDIVDNYDKVNLKQEGTERKLIFEKAYPHADIRSVELVSNNKNSLNLVTVYYTKKRGQFNQSVTSNLNGNSRLESTSSFNNSIPQKTENVKSDKTVINKDMQKKENNTNIQDFGEKIGGARKDTAMPRGTQKVAKEVIHDYTVKNTENGYSVDFKGKVLQDGFKTQKEAEDYILAFKNNVKSNLATVEKSHISDEYIIKILNPRTLKTTYTNKKFSNLQDAESYAMALSMYLKENGKNLFRPQIQKVTRVNEKSKNATKATGDNILNNFGFKGGEFGNWVTQSERQQFLNYAEDAFTDLAIALDVIPSDLGQNGDMSIAFGARGKGLTGAVAHFEPGKKVINMTRLKGAGSLAHEYGHSIDNWLSRLSGYDNDGMVTENAIARGRLSDNLRKAVNEVTDAINYNVSTNQEEVNKKNDIFEKSRKEHLEYHLKYLDKVFAGEATKYKRVKGKYESVKMDVTDEQKKDYQKIRKTLINGELQGEVDYKLNQQTLKTEKTYPKEIDTIKNMYKEIVGRKIDDDTLYWLFRYGKPTKQITEVKSESAYRKSAIELDEMTGRKSVYYSRIDEMWARAFEAYISDKLKSKGITDTYLVHSVNNSEYALFNPFPAGEERQNINKAFDNLVTVMKNEGILHENKTKTTEVNTNKDDDGIRYLKKNKGAKVFKQELANKFEELTGDSIKLAGAKLAGIELRNTWRQNGNLDGNMENNPYNKEAMDIYNKYQNSQKTSSYLYHATGIDRLESIIKNGLTTGNKQNQEGVSSSNEIYLSATPELAESYANSNSVTLRINPKFYNKFENFRQDYLGGTGSYAITNDIPPEMLQIKENGKWINLTNLRQEKDNRGRTLTKVQVEYFKDSKIRDENGNLLTMYHGTMADFNTFDIKKAGINYENNWSSLGKGFYFTPNYDAAKEFATAGTTGKTKNIKEVYINIVNPFETNKDYTQELSHLKKEYNVDDFILRKGYRLIQVLNENNFDSTKILKKLGFDGVIESYNKNIEQVVAFNSNQIKKVDNITPTSDEDIRLDKQQNIKIDKDSKEKSYQTNGERTDAWIEQEIKKVEETGNWDNTIPVTSLTDIRETIEDYLGLGIKKGKFRQDAYGIYKGKRDVIRTKEFKDIDSILHETGHALDLGNRLKLDKETIANELITAIDKLGGYEEETRAIKLEEGFAEVIREYSIIPEQAKNEYPQTVAVIEEIRQNDQSFDKFMTKVQQQTYNYIHQNPQNRVHSNISIGETNRTPLTKAWLEQEVMRNVYDKDYAVKKVVNEFSKISGKTVNQTKASNNAYYLTRLASGIGDKVTSMLSDGYINEQGVKLMPGLNKVGEILGDDPQRYNDLRDYLVARRDTDYKAKTLKTGIRDMDTKYVLEKFANDSQIKEASQVIYDTLDGVMKYAVENGLISQDEVKKLKESNAFYVPMQRVIEGKGNQVGRRGAVTDIIKARTGSELDIKDVLENIVANSSNIIQQVENNNILKALYNQGEEAGLTGSIYDVIDTPMMKVGTANLSMWENELKKQGVNTNDLDLEKTVDLFAPNNKVNIQERITSFINEDGKRVYLQFDKKCVDLFNALMNLDGKTMSFFLKINARLNMPLRYGATMANIGFAIPNMISDTAQAAIFSNAGFVPVVDNALGVLDILTATNKYVRNFVKNYSPQYVERIENLYNLYKQTGSTNSTRMSQFRDSTQSNMKEVYGTKNSEVLGIHEKWKPLKRLLDIMTYIPEISEQSTRFRVFEKNYDMYKSKGNSEMDARILAALESRDATQDFGRTGNFTREINQLIPFSAARVGSAYTFAEKVKANPKQTMMRIALLSAIAMAIKAAGYDDKEIEELNQRKKDDNFVMKVGDNIVTIKKPQGLLRSIVNLTEYIQDLATGHIDDGKEEERLGNWIRNAITDNMPADNPGGYIPNLAKPIIENWANKDLYYNTDIVKSYDLDLPDSEQYYDYNSQLAIMLGKVFNYSPAKIDNLISGYFAGLGTQITGTMDYISGKLGLTTQKPEMGAESDAVGKRFIVNVNSNSASVDEIYNRKTELTKKKNGGTITEEEDEELTNITNAATNMSKVNKQIREIKADLTLSGEEKAEQIKELQQQRTDIARQALGKDLIHEENTSNIETTSFYPTNSSLSLNKMTLELTSDMKKEYANLASEFYKRYERQGLYSEEKLKEIKSKAKDYAKKTLMQKYKSQLVRSK